MGKNALEIMSRVALSRGAESEPGEPSSTGMVSMDLDSGSLIQAKNQAGSNAETIHGAELPTAIYASPMEAAGTLSQARAKPDFIAFALSYFFGRCDSTLVGSAAYKHQITAEGGLELPTFTAVQRLGANVFTERLSGNYIDSFSIDLGEGWVSCKAEVTGTGKREVNYQREVVRAPADSTSIALSQNGVAGQDGTERLANLYRVRAKDAGSDAWQELVVSSVSADSPAVISFESALGSSGDEVDFYVDYIPTEPSWCLMPGAIDESPIKLTEAKVVVDGWFDGSDILGGRELRAGLSSFSVSGKNNLEMRRFPGESGPAACALRRGRELSITLSEELRNTIRRFQADRPETERISVALVARGAEMEPGGERFGCELIFPCCAVVDSSIEACSGRLVHAGDLAVMDDGTYGGAVVRCYNRQTGYL